MTGTVSKSSGEITLRIYCIYQTFTSVEILKVLVSKIHSIDSGGSIIEEQRQEISEKIPFQRRPREMMKTQCLSLCLIIFMDQSARQVPFEKIITADIYCFDSNPEKECFM